MGGAFTSLKGSKMRFEQLVEEHGRQKWCPEEEASFVSRLVFSWATGLFKQGKKKTLEFEDLWSVHQLDAAETVAQHLQNVQQRADPTERPSLPRALNRAFGFRFWAAGVIKLVYDLLQFASPLVIRELIQYLKEPEQDLGWGVSLAGALLACQIVQACCIHNYFRMVYRVGMHVRVAVISEVYSKALRISTTAKQATSTGEVVNLQSNDAEKLCDLCAYFHVIWSGPLQICGSLGLLFFVIGVIPALVGLVVMLLLLPFNLLMVRYLTNVRKRLVSATDARVKLITEVINGIKAIKLYAWEEPFRDRVNELRTEELKHVRSSVLIGTFNTFFYTLNPTLVAVASFYAYTLLGHRLDASVAFPALALFNILRFPLSMLPHQINQFIQASVSIQRLERFFALPEAPGLTSSPNLSRGTVSIDTASFTWAASTDFSDTPTLTNITLKVPPGQLLMIVGEVGSGKSSLLAALLGEMRRTSGKVALNGSVALTVQDAWIRNATLQDNILMGRPFDIGKYEKVLEACALRPDLQTLPGGDMCEIGEKGINLSGGQKQRVALARAAYADADIMLLDDPLSAVDTHVGRHLFEECICRLLEKKTRILVTHQLQFAAQADAIAVLERGTIAHYGTFSELTARGVDLAQWGDSSTPEEAEQETVGTENVETKIREPETAVLVVVEKQQEAQEAVIDKQEPKEEVPASDDAEDVPLLGTSKTVELADMSSKKGGPSDKPTSSKLIGKETRAVGSVKHRVYRDYLTAWGSGVPFWVALIFVTSALSRLLNESWLAIWTEAVRRGVENMYYYLNIYGLTAAIFSLLVWGRSTALALGCIAAGARLHRRLLERVLRLPMAFFDTQPSGRLVNRFTRDVEAIDVTLPDTVLSALSCLSVVVLALGIVCYVTPLFLFPLVPLIFVYYRIQRFYIASSRELKRLDSLARSPIFAHFGETLSGLSTIRAFAAQRSFERENSAKLNESTRAYHASVISNRWLGMRLEMLGAVVTFGTAFFAVWAHKPDAGFAGLALTSALSVTGYLTWMVRMTSDLETQMNSVERVLEYSSLPMEAPPIVPSTRPPKAWPSEGAIEAQGLIVRYRRDLPPVLNNLSFKLQGGEKVGVCGRTGCGKSTLMMTLYRIVELDRGRLLIDNLDVGSIGLQDLRSKLALVPQDPVIFSGTVRANLDPFGQAGGDNVLWDALRQAGLGGVVSALPGQLDADVAEGGANLSTGQRQLLCMARALLRRTKILVLDEATSNVDTATDGLIQSTIRGAFRACTVLTIAHRLHTIIDSDRVMLLEGGQVAELDTPAELLEDPSSRFSGFVDQTLPRQAAALRRAASARSLLVRDGGGHAE